jgi:hypothetical protein
MRLWQRIALDPSNEDTLFLLDCAFQLKFIAWRDGALRAQLSEAWAWVLKDNHQPTRSLALRSGKHARDVGIRERPPTPPGQKESA